MCSIVVQSQELESLNMQGVGSILADTLTDTFESDLKKNLKNEKKNLTFAC